MARRFPRCIPSSILVLVGAIVIGSGLGLGGPGNAAVHVSGDYVLEEGEVIDDDLIFNGERAQIDGVVRGDLLASGQEIVINGRIEADAIIAGSNLELNGTVVDDMRAAGYLIRLGEKARVGDDLHAAAYSVESERTSRIGGDANLVGYQARLDGEVDGDVSVAVAAFRLAGSVRGDVEAKASGDAPMGWIGYLVGSSRAPDSVEPGFEIDDDARIGGNLSYSAPGQIDVGEQVAGHIQFAELEPDEGEGGGGTDWLSVPRRWITIVAVGALLLWLARAGTEKLAARIREEPLPAVLWGAASVVAVGMLAAGVGLVIALAFGIVGGLTLGGLSPAIAAIGVLIEAALLTPFGLVAFYLPPVLAALLIGPVVLSVAKPEWETGPWAPLLAGAAAFAVLLTLPFVGLLLQWLALLAGVGALVLTVRSAFAPPAPAT